MLNSGFGRGLNAFSGFQSVESVQSVAKILTTAIIFMLLTGGCRRSDRVAENADPEPGVALSLATERAESIGGVRYRLAFTMPARAADPINCTDKIWRIN